jgi:hypothetical protein
MQDKRRLIGPASLAVVRLLGVEDHCVSERQVVNEAGDEPTHQHKPIIILAVRAL